jgi:O-6-methylguanine DNA methyltransferase
MTNVKITSFAKKVYKAVLTIPLGKVRTYRWVAEKIGRPKSARAVGQALKKNPYTLIIPCHRVVASNNKLGGYSLGIKIKEALLALEKELGNKIYSTKRV